MDHVQNSLRNWLNIYKDEKDVDGNYEDPIAVECIENAMKELAKYWKIPK